MKKLSETFRRWLVSAHFSWWAAALAFLFSLPVLWSGFLLDDYPQHYLIKEKIYASADESATPPTEQKTLSRYQGKGGPEGPWDIFRFQGPERGYFHSQQELGLWPWWTDPDLRLAFFRPLSSLHHALDYTYWPEQAWLMHLESLLLFCAIVLVASRLYRRLLGVTVTAGLAGLFFAVDDAHSMVVTWISNRNALWACLFGVLTLLYHDRWRREQTPRAQLSSSVFFLLAMLSGEAALGVTAYLFAYAVFLDQGSLAARAKTLAPYVAISVLWAVYYWSAGYGTTGGGFYIDPGREPLLFLGAMLLRLPVLLVAQLLLPPADIWTLAITPRGYIYLALILWLVLIVFGYAAYRALRSPLQRQDDTSGARRGVLGFFLTGMVLSLVPVCATWPADRLLLFSGLGAFGFLAMCVSRDWAGPQTEKRSRRSLLFAGALFSLHAILASALLPVRINFLSATFGRMFMTASTSLPPRESLRDKTVIYLNAPDPLVPSYAPLIQCLRDDAPIVAKSLRILAVATQGEVSVSRPDATTLIVSLSKGFLQEPFSKVFRGDGKPFSVGDVVRLSDMTATVTEITEDHRPKTVSFVFAKSLDDPSFAWLIWGEQGFTRFTPPAIGESRTLPPVDYNKALGM